jgi:hypothetical protein
MNVIKYLAIAALAATFIAAATPKAEAQVNLSIGVAPACPYGYYDYTPYGCAPYGYYGPEWFHRGAFIGVGPWFHGSASFHGHVNNSFDPQHGYAGHRPEYGERGTERGYAPKRFKGNEVRDGRGHGDGDRREGDRRDEPKH